MNVLARHHVLLGELVTTPALLIVTAGYSEASPPQAPHGPTGVDHILPETAYWTSVPMDEEPGSESWMHLYVSEVPYATHILEPLLRSVAGEEIANVLVADPS